MIRCKPKLFWAICCWVFNQHWIDEWMNQFTSDLVKTNRIGGHLIVDKTRGGIANHWQMNHKLTSIASLLTWVRLKSAAKNGLEERGQLELFLCMFCRAGWLFIFIVGEVDHSVEIQMNSQWINRWSWMESCWVFNGTSAYVALEGIISMSICSW